MDIALTFSLVVGVVWFLTRPQKRYSLSQWRERMKKLDLGTKFPR